MSHLFTSGAKVLKLQLQHQFFQWIFRVDFLEILFREVKEEVWLTLNTTATQCIKKNFDARWSHWRLYLLCSTLEPTYIHLMWSNSWITVISARVHYKNTDISAEGTNFQCLQSSQASEWNEQKLLMNHLCEKAMLYSPSKVENRSLKEYIPQFISCALKLHCLSSFMSVSDCLRKSSIFFPQSSDLCLYVWDKRYPRLRTFFLVPLLLSGHQLPK